MNIIQGIVKENHPKLDKLWKTISWSVSSTTCKYIVMYFDLLKRCVSDK